MLTASAVLLLALGSRAAVAEPPWLESYDEASRAARAAGKPLLVYVFDSV